MEPTDGDAKSGTPVAALLRDPLVPPLFTIAAGVLAARVAQFQVRELVLAIAVLAALAIAGCCLRAWLGAGAACLAAMMCAGALTATLHRLPPAPELDAAAREVMLFSGCVVQPPALSPETAAGAGGREQFVLEIEPGAHAQVNLYAREGETAPPLRYGQRVEVEGRPRRVRNFRNPGSFDFERYMARNDIYWTVSARASVVRVIGSDCGSPFWSGVFALRTAALRRLDRLYPGDSYNATMLKAILIGDSTNLEKSWTEDYRRTGTYHALVISGLHVTVLAGVLLFLLRLCFVPEGASLVLTCAAGWLYAFVSGWTAPVVRAAAGFTLFAAGRYFYRRGRLLNLLAAVAIGYLVLDPEQIVEASFQLSFLSVAAIGALAVPLLDRTEAPFARALPGLADAGRDIHVAPRVASFRLELRLLAETAALWTRIPQRACVAAVQILLRAWFYAIELVLISATVQVGLALPMAYYFHRISVTGLSANVVIVPLLSLVVPVGFGAIFGGGRILALAAGGLLWASRQVAGWHVRWEPPFRIPDPPAWVAAAYAAALLLTAVVFYRKASSLRFPFLLPAFAVAALLAVVLIHPFPPAIERGSLELTMIDVGQGDSLLLAFPDGRTALLDAGGVPAFGKKRRSRLDIGEDVVSPYLWSRSIRRLDTVILSHAHEDHSGGIAAVMDNFRPAELWGTCRPDPIWTSLAERARKQGARVVCLAAGANFRYGGGDIQVLAPTHVDTGVRTAVNNDSLVLRVSYGRHSFLLAGDAERQVEAGMLAAGALGQSDVLKVAHHGGRNSSTDPFLDTVRPVLALISVGFENSYNSPHPLTLARLAAHHSAVLRTDVNGLVTVRTDGHRLRFGDR